MKIILQSHFNCSTEINSLSVQCFRNQEVNSHHDLSKLRKGQGHQLDQSQRETQEVGHLHHNLEGMHHNELKFFGQTGLGKPYRPRSDLPAASFERITLW